MCCCCRCSKCLKIICSIIWGAVLLALIIVIIIIAVAYGGSKVAQELVSDLTTCNRASKDDSCEGFGHYVAEICDAGNYNLKCIGIGDNKEKLNASASFGWIMEFTPRENRNLGVFVRMSNKGIKNNNQDIMMLTSTLKEPVLENPTTIYLKVPTDNKDINYQVISDQKNQYIVHDRYVHMYPYAICEGNCPESADLLKVTVQKAQMHLKMTFKTVPDFIGLTFDDDEYNYEKFVDNLYKIVKVFSKDAATSMKNSMTNMGLRVRNFQEQTLCPISPKYEPSLDTQN